MVVAALAIVTPGSAAQAGGKPARGNPTPGTPQPDPPNPADRITLTGCVQMTPSRSVATDANTPSSSLYVLANAERQKSVPDGTGASHVTTSTPSTPLYRLETIDSQLSPFVGAKGGISGEGNPRPREKGGQGNGINIPTVRGEIFAKIETAWSLGPSGPVPS